MKQRITALAEARGLSITELLMRALDAYASPDVGDRLDNYKHIDFAPRHRDLLRRVASFFGSQIEASPGHRLYHAEVGGVPRVVSFARQEGEHQRR